MTPDVFTNLRILNGTSFTLESSNVGSYQMASWPFPDNASLVAPQSCSEQYFLQFLRGVGDEDDAGTLNMNIESSTIVFLYGGSAPNSAHYMQVTLTPLGSLPFVVGLVTNDDWPQAAELASLVSWYVPSGQIVELGNLSVPQSPQNPNKAIAIVDLSQIYSPADATVVQNAITANTLTSQQLTDLWSKVSSYTNCSQASS